VGRPRRLGRAARAPAYAPPLDPLVVAAVGFQTTGALKTKTAALSVDVPRFTAAVDGIAARVPAASTQQTSASASSAQELGGTADVLEQLAGRFKLSV
jgi:hypothetical protein